MKATTLFLGFTGLVLAGMIILLWQMFAPRPQQETGPAPSARAKPAPALRSSEPDTSGVRSVYRGLGNGSAQPAPSTTAAPRVATTPAQPEPVPPASVSVPAQDEPASAADASGGVDLNTATLDQLNALGAGMIGRTIVANRPYAAPEDLVGRRVLTRRDYEIIRPHIVAR